MAGRPLLALGTRGLSSLSQQITDTDSPVEQSPAEQRDDAKRNMLKAMRPLPTQHYWDVYFDGQSKDKKPIADGNFDATLEKIGKPIESVQDFWRYNNNTPVDQIKMRESIYLFKQGFRPIWEDRRNLHGGSWTFRVPKAVGADFWTRIQTLAIGEKLQSVLAAGDQLCGVGLSVRFSSHLISIWHRQGSNQKSIDAILACVLAEMPEELRPRTADNYFYKKHSDHAGFKAPAPPGATIASTGLRSSALATAPVLNASAS